MCTVIYIGSHTFDIVDSMEADVCRLVRGM